MINRLSRPRRLIPRGRLLRHGAHHVPRKPAFTLVELLVVVAIIVALLAILLPSMGRSVEIAQAAQCGSQQRQLSLATLSYAQANNLVLPLGYVSNNIKHGNYYLAHNDGPVCMLGLLYHTGILDDPRLYYCPSITAPSGATFDYYADAFVDGKIDWTQMASSGNAVRATYLARPVVNWDDTKYLGLDVKADDELSSMPRLHTFRGSAIIACSNTHGGNPHAGAANVSTVDASTRYVAPEEIVTATGDTHEEIADLIDSIGHHPENNTNITQLWEFFDRR